MMDPHIEIHTGTHKQILRAVRLSALAMSMLSPRRLAARSSGVGRRTSQRARKRGDFTCLLKT